VKTSNLTNGIISRISCNKFYLNLIRNHEYSTLENFRFIWFKFLTGGTAANIFIDFHFPSICAAFGTERGGTAAATDVGHYQRGRIRHKTTQYLPLCP
jgi:hypothetical protein